MAQRIAVAAAIVLVVVLALVGGVEAGLPIGGVSRGDAIAAAKAQVPSTTPESVSWAIVAPLVFFRGGASDAVAPWNEIVWAVRLAGTYPPASCGPVPPPGQQPGCPPDEHNATVVIDYRTRQFVMANFGP